MKPSFIGGQAVMEGVMMKNKDRYAVAVRKPDHEIEVMTGECHSIIKNKRLTTTPFVRGIFNFIDSLVLGMKSLSFSADFFLEEEEGENEKKENKKSTDAMMAGTMVLAVFLAIGLFVGIPFLAAEGLRRFVTSSELVVVICEGLIRLGLFLLYVALISQMQDIRRVYMYHGAEHKCINCIENGLPLTVENVRKSSRQHTRCGTSFLLFVMLIGIVVGFMIYNPNPLIRLGLRLLMIPVVAGIAYECIRLAGRSEHPLVRLLSKPGLWLQKLTTAEPDDEMIEVGIKSVEAVFDWQAFLDGEEDASTEQPS